MSYSKDESDLFGIAGLDRLTRIYHKINKYQITSTKPGPRPEGGDSEGEITNKSQIPILNHQNRFGILKLGTRPQGGESKRSADNFGHCYLFDI